MLNNIKKFFNYYYVLYLKSFSQFPDKFFFFGFLLMFLLGFCVVFISLHFWILKIYFILSLIFFFFCILLFDLKIKKGKFLRKISHEYTFLILLNIFSYFIFFSFFLLILNNLNKLTFLSLSLIHFLEYYFLNSPYMFLIFFVMINILFIYEFYRESFKDS